MTTAHVMQTKRALMTERDEAVRARDWARMNALTRQIADLPFPGLKPLTQRDIDRYVNRKAR